MPCIAHRLGSDDESDDDTPLSCAKKLADKSPMAPLDRPSIVPALDFESLAEKLAAADKAEAEAEAAEKASKGEVSTTAWERERLSLGCVLTPMALCCSRLCWRR